MENSVGCPAQPRRHPVAAEQLALMTAEGGARVAPVRIVERHFPSMLVSPQIRAQAKAAFAGFWVLRLEKLTPRADDASRRECPWRRVGQRRRSSRAGTLRRPTAAAEAASVGTRRGALVPCHKRSAAASEKCRTGASSGPLFQCARAPKKVPGDLARPIRDRSVMHACIWPGVI
jgi:hypothetical protein